MMEAIPIYVGYDPREPVAYHAFCSSVLRRASGPVAFIPLALNTLRGYTERHVDGSNQFIYSRFLVPWLQHWNGWAIFADGDMICNADIYDLWRLRDAYKAVMVCQHDYKTKAPVKYLGAPNQDYPRKNWSSLILWNCGHYANRNLTPDRVEQATGAELHRFLWLEDRHVGSLPLEWNWLAEEYPFNPEAKLVHYTLGTPCFDAFRDCAHAPLWHNERKILTHHQAD